MFKSVYLIGDCQSNRVYEHYNQDESFIKLILWGKGGKSAWNFDPEKLKKREALGDGLQHGVYSKTYEPIRFSQIVDPDVIIAWFGYIDCKWKMLVHDDAEKTAYKYVNTLKKEFPETKILLVEPLPQFVEDIYIEEEKLPVFKYDLRRKTELDFCSYLKKFAKDFGITDYITQEEILKALGLSKLTADNCARNLEGGPVDGLKAHHNLAIYNLFVQKAIKLIS